MLNINFSDLQVGDSLWWRHDRHEYKITDLNKTRHVVTGLEWYDGDIIKRGRDFAFSINTIRSVCVRHKPISINWRKRIEK